MMKTYASIVIVGIAVFLASAELPLLRQSKRFTGSVTQNNKKPSARQELPASAPYPPSGVTPEVPFDLPTENEDPLPEPDQTYGPPKLSPDTSYLPPEPIPDITYGTPVAKPDETYGPPYIPETDNANSTYIQPGLKEPLSEEFSTSGRNLVSENLLEFGEQIRKRLRSVELKTRRALRPSRLQF